MYACENIHRKELADVAPDDVTTIIYNLNTYMNDLWAGYHR